MKPKNITDLSPFAGFLLLLLLIPAQGGIAYYVSTDASGSFVNASAGGAAGTRATWTGNGTVQANVSGGNMTLIDDFSGTATLGNLSMDRHGTYYDVTYTLTAADPMLAHSADLFIQNSGGGDKYGALQLRNMVNVGAICITSTFAEPIAAARSSNTAAWGMGFRRGTGNEDDLYDATVSIGGLITVTDITTPGPFVEGTHYELGVPSGELLNMEQGDESNLTFTPGAAPYGTNATDVGFESEIKKSTDWVGINGLDIDGNGDSDLSNANNGVLDGEDEITYLTSMKICVESSASTGTDAFESNARFQFTIDGQQHNDTLGVARAAAGIPEPSGAILLELGVLSMMLRRRR